MYLFQIIYVLRVEDIATPVPLGDEIADELAIMGMVESPELDSG